MTIKQQNQILRKHVIAFLKHQRAATLALQAINEIGLRENEGNPYRHPIQGEDMLRYASTGDGVPAFHAPFVPGEFSDVIEQAQNAINANAYIV